LYKIDSEIPCFGLAATNGWSNKDTETEQVWLKNCLENENVQSYPSNEKSELFDTSYAVRM